MTWQSSNDEILVELPLSGALDTSGLYYAECVTRDKSLISVGKGACPVHRASDSREVYRFASSPVLNIGINTKPFLRQRMANKVRELEMLAKCTSGLPADASIRLRKLPEWIILSSNYPAADWEHCLLTVFALITGSLPLMNSIRSEADDGTSTMRVHSFRGNDIWNRPPLDLIKNSGSLFWDVVDELFFRRSGDSETSRRIQAAQLLLKDFFALSAGRTDAFRKVSKAPCLLLLHADVPTAPGLNFDHIGVSIAGNPLRLRDKAALNGLVDGVVSVITGLDFLPGAVTAGTSTDLRKRSPLIRTIGGWHIQ